jgi:hypothetical protein
MLVRPPVRVTHTFTQTLDAPPAAVLPLLCPVREAEWVPGWSPALVLSDSGVAEPDCVFTTPDAAAGPDAEAIWTVLAQDADAGTVEMLKVTPGFLVVRLQVALRPAPDGRCLADVTYRYTALSASGEAYVAARTPEAYAAFMRDWERALNDFLRTRAGPTAAA